MAQRTGLAICRLCMSVGRALAGPGRQRAPAKPLNVKVGDEVTGKARSCSMLGLGLGRACAAALHVAWSRALAQLARHCKPQGCSMQTRWKRGVAFCVGKHARVHAVTLVRCCAACAGCGVCQAVCGLVVLVVSRLTCACSVRRAYMADSSGVKINTRSTSLLLDPERLPGTCYQCVTRTRNEAHIEGSSGQRLGWGCVRSFRASARAPGDARGGVRRIY